MSVFLYAFFTLHNGDCIKQTKWDGKIYVKRSQGAGSSPLQVKVSGKTSQTLGSPTSIINLNTSRKYFNDFSIDIDSNTNPVLKVQVLVPSNLDISVYFDGCSSVSFDSSKQSGNGEISVNNSAWNYGYRYTCLGGDIYIELIYGSSSEPTVDGVCNFNSYACLYGTRESIQDDSYGRIWNCKGSGGGKSVRCYKIGTNSTLDNPYGINKYIVARRCTPTGSPSLMYKCTVESYIADRQSICNRCDYNTSGSPCPFEISGGGWACNYPVTMNGISSERTRGQGGKCDYYCPDGYIWKQHVNPGCEPIDAKCGNYQGLCDAGAAVGNVVEGDVEANLDGHAYAWKCISRGNGKSVQCYSDYGNVTSVQIGGNGYVSIPYKN